MLVKSDSTSKLAITRLESKLNNSSANENESLTVYSFEIKGANKGTKIFVNLYVVVPISDKIGRKGGTSSSIGLCILARPYKIPGLEPKGCKSLYFFSEICCFSLSFLRTSVIQNYSKRYSKLFRTLFQNF